MAYINTYNDLVKLMGDKPFRYIPRSWGYPRATELVQHSPGVYALVYHLTPVVTYYPDCIKLDSGGFRTLTTKKRINDYVPNIYLYSSGGVWYIRHWLANSVVSSSAPFMDNMRVSWNGEWLDFNEMDALAEGLRVKTTRATIRTYANWLVTHTENISCPTCALYYEQFGTIPNAHLMEHAAECAPSCEIMMCAARLIGPNAILTAVLGKLIDRYGTRKVKRTVVTFFDRAMGV